MTKSKKKLLKKAERKRKKVPKEVREAIKDEKLAAKRARRDAREAAAQAKAVVPSPAAPATLGKRKRASEDDINDYLLENAITYEPVGSSLTPVLSFDTLNVEDALRTPLLAFDQPTPIQAAAWPVLLAGRDVVGIAKTGSGKTLAFGIPALQHIGSLPEPTKKAKKSKPDRPPPAGAVNVLILAPTRELAMQIHASLDGVACAQDPAIPTACIYGGVPKADQIDALKGGKFGARLVAGTPGRLLDMANEGNLDLSNVSYLVLDEADRMLDAGFEQEVRKIIAMCKAERQTAMFSATWPQSVRSLASDFMRSDNLVRITVGSDELAANTAISQTVLVLGDGREKDGKLLDTLRVHGTEDKALVFCLYKKEAARVHGQLERKGYNAVCIQGDMSQAARTESLEAFRDGTSKLMVATDVACRGLDVPMVELVVNYTFPLTIEDYVHRIGRTGRAGRTGKSITFFTSDDKAHAGELQRVLREAGQDVPEELRAFGGTIKKATHSAYGSHFRDDIGGTAKKIKFE